MAAILGVEEEAADRAQGPGRAETFLT